MNTSNSIRSRFVERRLVLLQAMVCAMALAACTGPHHAVSQIQGRQQLYLCVMTEHGIQVLEAQLDTATGDTLVQGRSYRELHQTGSPPYTEHGQTFRADRAVVVRGSRLVANRPEQVLTPMQVGYLERYTEVGGVPVFTERGHVTPPTVIYVPVRPGCVFQSFQRVEAYPIP